MEEDNEPMADAEAITIKPDDETAVEPTKPIAQVEADLAGEEMTDDKVDDAKADKSMSDDEVDVAQADEEMSDDKVDNARADEKMSGDKVGDTNLLGEIHDDMLEVFGS
jgi:hypothetical protein